VIYAKPVGADAAQPPCKGMIDKGSGGKRLLTTLPLFCVLVLSLALAATTRTGIILFSISFARSG